MTFGGSGGGPVFIIIPQLCPHLVTTNTMHMYATTRCMRRVVTCVV